MRRFATALVAAGTWRTDFTEEWTPAGGLRAHETTVKPIVGRLADEVERGDRMPGLCFHGLKPGLCGGCLR